MIPDGVYYISDLGAIWFNRTCHGLVMVLEELGDKSPLSDIPKPHYTLSECWASSLLFKEDALLMG